MPQRRLKLVAILTATAILGVLIAGGAWWAFSNYQATHGPECTVPRPVSGTVDSVRATDTGGQPRDAEPLGLDAVQLQHASTINAVGLGREENLRARVIAVATAWQESSLRNIDRGDRDSLGLFQQRPSQGWGDPDEIMDPIYASNQFYDHLAKVRDWQDMSLTEAAQAVQRSGFPDAYAKWGWDAQTLVDQLSGDQILTLTCRRGAHASTVDAPLRPALVGTAGASPRLVELLAAAQAEMTGVTVARAMASKRDASVTVALTSVSADVAAQALAAWFVAHSSSFGVSNVQVGDRLWTDHTWQLAAESLQPGHVSVTVAITAADAQ